MSREIVVAGAGVAGLTAAINLKLAGHSVRVFERNRASGAQRYTEWDAVENWTSLEDFPVFLKRLGLNGSHFRQAGRTRFSVIDPFDRQYNLQTQRPFFYLIKRGAVPGGLEYGLQAQAADLNIPIEYETACPADQADIWAGGTFGRGSRFVSVGFTFHTQHPDWVCGIVDTSIAPRAYAYLVIQEGEGTLAVVLTEAYQSANQLLERARLAFEKHTNLQIQNPHHSGGSGGDLASFWSGHSDFVIGEAAGFQDFLWGFGIRHALNSGYLAAQSIITGQNWQTLAEQQIRPLVRASLINRWFYDHTPAWGYAALIHYFAGQPDLNALVGRWYHPRRFHQWLWPVLEPRFRRQALSHTRPDAPITT
jgi:NAD(P)-binding Rossmann-like domain